MEVKKEDLNKYLAVLGNRDVYCVFSGMSEWNEARRAYAIPPSSPRKRTEWVERKELSEILKRYVKLGWAVWVSLNEKETGSDTIEGVKRIHTFWFDFDAKHEDKSCPATSEESEVARKEAERFRSVMEDKGLRGFLACSGNGYHVYFPVHGYDLRGMVARKEFNQKQKEFSRRLRDKSGFKFDVTTDIRRVTQPIGFPNLKIADHPLPTYWLDDFSVEDIEEARGKNDQMIEAVLDTEITQAIPPTTPSPRQASENFNALLEKDEKLRALYRGDVELSYDKDVEKYRKIREETGKLVYTSRSEAELALVTMLCQKGFSGSEIYELMAGCGIGKWQEKPASYAEITVKKAQTFVEELDRKGRGRGRPPTKSEQKISYMSIILRDLMKRYTFVTPDDTQEVHVYDHGIYKRGEVLVASEVEGILEDEVDATFVNEVIGHIQRRTYVPRERFNADRSLLPVKNGLLNLNTYKLQDFDPNKIFTYQLPVNFDPQARCPNIEAFIQSVLSPGDIPVVQEYVGYCLYPDMPAHKSLWLYGSGRNGKTTFVNLVRALLGEISTVSVGLDELSPNHRFSKARLYGKLLNVVPEPTQKEMVTIDFKRLVGGDLISAEVKNKQKPINFVNVAKFIIYGNRFPLVRDTTDAFWYRVKTVKFPYTFTETAVTNYDKVLIEKDGLSGFLNWCLEGLKRLKAQDFQFTTSKESEDTRSEFMRQSNSVKSFVNDRCVLKPTEYVSKEELFNHYKDYCDKEELEAVGKKLFSQILSETPRVYSKQMRVGGKTQRCWIGIIPTQALKAKIDELLEKAILYVKHRDTTETYVSGAKKTAEETTADNRQRKPTTSPSPSASSVKGEGGGRESRSRVEEEAPHYHTWSLLQRSSSKDEASWYVCDACHIKVASMEEWQYPCEACGMRFESVNEMHAHKTWCEKYRNMPVAEVMKGA